MLICILICVLYYAAHRLYSAFFCLSFNTAPYLFSRLSLVLQMMVLSETVFVSVIHRAC